MSGKKEKKGRARVVPPDKQMGPLSRARSWVSTETKGEERKSWEQGIYEGRKRTLTCPGTTSIVRGRRPPGLCLQATRRKGVEGGGGSNAGKKSFYGRREKLFPV